MICILDEMSISLCKVLYRKPYLVHCLDLDIKFSNELVRKRLDRDF